MSEDRKFINVCLATGENLIAELASTEDVEKLPVQLDINNVQLKNVAIILRKDIQSPMMLLPWIDHIERDGVVSISVDKINWYCPVNDEFVEQYEAEGLNNAVAGFTTTSKTRPLIIAKMEEFVRNNLFTIKSVRMVNEMRTFIWNNGKPEAMRSYNDDLVLACAVGCWVSDTALSVNKRDVEYKKAFMNSMIRSSTELRTKIPGQIGYKKDNLFDTMKHHKSNVDSFPWLFKG